MPCSNFKVAPESGRLPRQAAQAKFLGIKSPRWPLVAAQRVPYFSCTVCGQILGDEIADSVRVLRQLDRPHLWAGRAKGAILEEHAQDCNHCKTAVGQLCIELPLAQGWDWLDGVEGPNPAKAVPM